MVNKYVKAGVQSDLETAASSLTPVSATEFTVSVDQQVVYINTMDSYNPADAVFGPLKISESFTTYAIPGQIDIFLEAIFGAKSTPDVGVAEYTLSEPKALTVEVGDEEGNAYKLTGVLVTSAELSFDIKDVMKFTGNYVARYIEDTTHNYAAGSGKPYVIWDTTITVDGSTFKLSEFSLTIERGIAEDAYVIGSRLLDEIRYGETNVNGSGTIARSMLSEFKRAVYGSTTATAPQNEPSYADITITAKTPDGNNMMVIDLPTVVYPKGTLTMNATDFSTRSFDWRLVGDQIKVTTQPVVV